MTFVATTAATTEEERAIRSLRVIYLAILASTTLFLLITLYLARTLTGREPRPGTPVVLHGLSLAHLLLAVTLYSAAGGFFRRGLKSIPPLLSASVPSADDVRRYHSASVLRLALYEAVAFLGLVVCLMGAVMGALRQTPSYWLNVFSYVALVAHGMRTFPSLDRLREDLSVPFPSA